MSDVNKICGNCGESFFVNARDIEFYEKITPVISGEKLPLIEQRFCPQCREQRRLSIRNERNFYKRRSSLSGKELISFISPDKPYKVYSKDEWWSDKWDAMDYGRDFDFNRPFFDQFNELMLDVPKMHLNSWQSENCDYCSFIDFSRNCYLVFGASSCKDCYYSNLIDSSNDLIDTLGCKESELGYDSVECIKCMNFVACIKCENSNDIKFCFDCKNCSDCFGCYNLNRKQYCLFNQQYSEDEYFEKLKEFDVGSRKVYTELKKKSLDFMRTKAIHKFAKVINCENCTGDNLTNSKNTFDSFDSNNLEDSRYVQFSMNSKDSYDFIGSSARGAELVIEAMCVEGKRILSGYYIAGHNDIYYCDSVFSCKDIFGCVGIKNKKYCILNKQYSKEEYEKLLTKIVQHMVRAGEWGEFFPIKYSPFAYNETVANEYYPLSKEEILAKGYKWKDLEEKSLNVEKYNVPDDIKNTEKEILERVLVCELSGRNFKIIPQEFQFYKKMGVPVPVICPDKRHEERMKLKNPRNLWNRNCSSCGKEIQTSYSPDRPETVYCEECYLKKVY